MTPVQNIPHLTPARLQKRRATYFALVLLTTLAGAWLMTDFLLHTGNGLNGLEIAMVVVFTPLFYQLATGFWLAIMGVYIKAARTPDPLDLTNSLKPEEHAARLDGSVGIIMPVYNEDVTRVFEGLRVIFQSLEKTGHLKNFDFFVLSDSDSPNKWIEEETAWLELCKQLNACDVWRNDGADDADHGQASRHRHFANSSPGVWGGDLVWAGNAVCGSALWRTFHGGTELHADGGCDLLGSQCNHPPGTVHRILRAARTAGKGTVWRAHLES